MGKFIARMPSTSAAVSALALVLSVIHEWGYFSLIGEKWKATLAIRDYLTLTVEWLPYAIMWVGLYIAFDVFALASAYSASSRNKQGTRAIAPVLLQRVRSGLAKTVVSIYTRVGNFLFRLVPWIFALAVITTYLTAQSYDWLVLKGLTAAVAWSATFLWCFKTIGHHFEINRSALAAMGIFPAALMITFALGARHAHVDLNTGEIFTVTIQDEKIMQQVVILRSIERGILLHDRETGTNRLLPWDQIVSISREDASEQRALPICTFVSEQWCEHLVQLSRETSRSR